MKTIQSTVLCCTLLLHSQVATIASEPKEGNAKPEMRTKTSNQLQTSAATKATAKAATKATAATKVTTPYVAPEARALMNEMLATYRNLTSLTCAAELKAERNSKPIQTLQVTVAYQKPRKVSLIVKDSDGSERSGITDGNHTYIYSATQFKDKYWRMALAGPAYGEEALVPQRPFGTLSTLLFCGIDPFQTIWEKPPQTVTLDKPAILDGTPVHILTAVISPGEKGIRHVYYIGKEDLLLRRTVITEGNSYKEMTSFSDIKTNPDIPAATFVFTPPEGAVEAEEPYWNPRLKKGGAPIPFTAKDTKGKPLSLDQYKGKVVLLSFWASWCGPCMGETPHIKAAYNKYKSRGFDVVGISLDEDRKEMDDYLKKNGLPWRQVYDGKRWQSAIARQYGIRGIPFAVLIGRDGKIVALHAETQNLLLDENIQRALAKK